MRHRTGAIFVPAPSLAPPFFPRGGSPEVLSNGERYAPLTSHSERGGAVGVVLSWQGRATDHLPNRCLSCVRGRTGERPLVCFLRRSDGGRARLADRSVRQYGSTHAAPYVRHPTRGEIL
jgi:hypothetical protein